MQISSEPIGIFDSGVGGFTALKKLAEVLPNQDFIYLGDTARVPYGNRSIETIIHYTTEGIEFLLNHSVKQILIACNTASAVALTEIRKISPVPIWDVINPAVQNVVYNDYQRVGIIGTRATIHSCAYEREIQKNQKTPIFTYSQACPLLVPFIEEGWEEHPAALAILETYLKPIQQAKIQALILGCTHYSAMKVAIQRLLPHINLIDSGVEAAVLIANQLNCISTPSALSTNFNKKRQIKCYITDLTPIFSQLAYKFLGISEEFLYQVSL